MPTKQKYERKKKIEQNRRVATKKNEQNQIQKKKSNKKIQLKNIFPYEMHSFK